MRKRILTPILLLALQGCSDRADLSCERCSVLFLNLELLRADHVGLLNPACESTPSIDEFFASSALFTEATAPAGETARSSSAVLSAVEGLFFKNTFIRSQKEQHPDKLRTLVEILDANGFTTVGINEGGRSGRRTGYGSGFQRYHELDRRALVAESLALVAEELKSLRGERFFLLYHSNALHAGYPYPLGRPRLEAESVEYVEQNDRFYVNADFEPLAPTEKRSLARALFAQQLEYVDEHLAPLFKMLQEDGFEHTIVVLFSNHGEGLFDNGIVDHGVSYQSCVHVPLLIRHPHLDGPLRIETPVSLVDLAPTICDLVGAEIGDKPFASSLVPLMSGGKPTRDYIFGRDLQTRYVRHGDWKLIAGPPDELYDLQGDPYELNDLIDVHPDVADRLRLVLHAREKAVTEYRLGGALEAPPLEE